METKKTNARNRLETKARSVKGENASGNAQKQQVVKVRRKAGNPNLGKDFPANFKAGQSGNPGGKPTGSRNRLQGDFIRALAEDFAQHGREAIQTCRIRKPDVYIKVVASLLPREIDMKRPLEGMSDEELEACIAQLRKHTGAPPFCH